MEKIGTDKEFFAIFLCIVFLLCVFLFLYGILNFIFSGILFMVALIWVIGVHIIRDYKNTTRPKRKITIKLVVDNIATAISYMFIIVSVVFISSIYIEGMMNGTYTATVHFGRFGEQYFEIAILLICWVAFTYHFSGKFKDLISKIMTTKLTKKESSNITGLFMFLICSGFILVFMWDLVIN